MPEGLYQIELDPPLGGQRGDVVPYRVPPGFLWRSYNVLDRYGELRTRPGLHRAAQGPMDSRVMGGLSFLTIGGVRELIAASQTAWYTLASSGDLLQNLSSGVVTFTGGVEDHVRFATFPSGGINWCLGTNNRDPLYKWDGAAASLVLVGGNPPIGRDITVSANYVVLGNVVEAGVRSASRIRVSNFNNPDAWDQYGAADLYGTNDNIVAVRALTRTSFAVYKDHSVWLGFAQLGLFPFTFECMDLSPGPVSPAAVVTAGVAHYYFASDHRIYRFAGQRAEPVSAPVDRYLQDAVLPSALRGFDRGRAWGYYRSFDRTVWFYYPGFNSPEPHFALSHHIDTGATYLHVYPIPLSAGWQGEDVSTLAWNDLTGTWDVIGPGSYPTWDSFGGTFVPAGFAGGVDGFLYRLREDADDDGRAIPQLWEFPLKTWLGMQYTSHLDGLESFFQKMPGGPTVTIQIGVSSALGDSDDLTYIDLGLHDTQQTTRQKFTLPDLDMRFWSIRYTVSSRTPIRFLGGMAAAWREEVPEQGVVLPTQIVVPATVSVLAEGQWKFTQLGNFPTPPYFVGVNTDWDTMVRVTDQTPTQFTLQFQTPAPPPNGTIVTKVIP